LGHIEYDELPRWYTEADVVVFPTLADEWGVVVAEALAAGVPVLGSVYSQAVDELIEPFKNGWLFRPDSQEETYASLKAALEAPAVTRAVMAEHCRASVSTLLPGAVA